MTIAFQPSAFQGGYPGPLAAFQTFDRYVALGNSLNSFIVVRDFLTIQVGPLMTYYERTTAIVIECTILDPSQDPPILFDPTTVQINIINPDGTSKVTLGSMTKISTGFYRYILQTVSNDQLGVYELNIKAVSGSNTAQTITQGAFHLLDT